MNCYVVHGISIIEINFAYSMDQPYSVLMVVVGIPSVIWLLV